MKSAVRKEILYDLSQAAKILQTKDQQDIEELRKLSDHGIEDVALHKDLDLISVAVLLYSIYKVSNCLGAAEYKELSTALESARKNLEMDKLGAYNRSIRSLYAIVRRCNAKVREHLQSVMDAARIKKGTTLLEKGLSIGQAAGLMGLSNWDLQQYAAKTIVLTQHMEKVKAVKRMEIALRLFA